VSGSFSRGAAGPLNADARQAGLRVAESAAADASASAPNDPLYVNQTHYAAIAVPQAWALTAGAASVVVRVTYKQSLRAAGGWGGRERERERERGGGSDR
jgi:hypothetical protein